jgi:putative FmdB family regulatory protein
VPTYAYVCTECDHAFEAVQAITDDALTQCPSCGGLLRKKFHPVGVTFKGSGFYRTDSRAGSSGSSATPATSGTGDAAKSKGSSSDSSGSGGSSSGSKSDSSGSTSGSKGGGASSSSSPAGAASS